MPRCPDSVKDSEPTELDDAEIFWRDCQPWLKSCGYQLRRRYRPGWVPAWTQQKTSLFWWEFEDSVKARHPSVMDAKCSDGTPVMLKRIRTSEHPMEVEMTQYLGSVDDKRNHSPRVHQVLAVPESDDFKILVFPLLRRFDSPEFETIGETVEFFRQLLEGVHFLHRLHVAHRDIGVLNIMMNNRMFPAGYHPASPSMTPDYKGKAKYRPRTLCSPRYYLIDFGLSLRFEDLEKPMLADPVRGQDKTVPEFTHGLEGTYDPFPTDVYYVGNFIREHFFEGKDDVSAKAGLEFMEDIVREMCSDDPIARPRMDDVVAQFDKVRRALSNSKLRSRLRGKNEGVWKSITLDAAHWCRRIKYTMAHVPPVPPAT